MSDYLSRLAAKNLNPAETVQPRVWSHFEPPSADGVPSLDSNFGSGEGEDGSVPDEAESQGSLSVLPPTPLLVERSADPARPPHLNRSGEPLPSDEVGDEMAGSVRRGAFGGQPPSSETMRKNTWPDSNNAERIPSTSNGESGRSEALHYSDELTTKTPVGNVQAGSSEVRVDTEKVGTVRKTAVYSEPQAAETMLNGPLQDPNRSAEISSTTKSGHKIIDAIPPSIKLSNKTIKFHAGSSEARGDTEKLGSVRKTAVYSEPQAAETMLNGPLSDPNRSATIPSTTKSEHKIIDTIPPSIELSNKTIKFHAGSTEARGDTEKLGSIRRTAVFANSPAPETILNRRLPDPDKSAPVPVTAGGETSGTDSQSSSQEVSKLEPSERWQPGSSAPTARTEKVGAVFRGVTDSIEPSNETIPSLQKPYPHEEKRHLVRDKMEMISEIFSGETDRGETDGTDTKSRQGSVLKRSRHDRRRQASSSATAGTGMVRRDDRTEIGDPLTPYENISLQTFPEPKRARGRLGAERVETTTIAAGDGKKPPEMRQHEPSMLATRALLTRDDNIGTIQRKAASVDAQSSIQKPSGDSPPDRIRQEHSVVRSNVEKRRETGQKAVDRPSPSPEQTSDRPGQILEANKILPRPAKAKTLETAADNGHQTHAARREEKTAPMRKVLPPTDQNLPKNLSSFETTQPISYLETDRYLEVGFDGGDGAAPSRGPFKKQILDHNPRAAVIAHPEAALFFEPGRGSSSPPAVAAPTIHVKIGRVEVRAAGPQAPISKPQRNARSSARKLSLDDYLKQRNGGRS